ncbi:hypothetical protein HYV91_02760 [Candidatus Wolfebacteria bacterium]|nr:hypothetical protein [Candidatus Wolfebacteria bacterium]
MYNPTKPYKDEIVSLVRQTWETPYALVKDGVLYKKFFYPEFHHADGVGTKGIYHWKRRTFKNAVLDAMAMNLNDMLMARAMPYALIDHVFLPRDDKDAILGILSSLVLECRERQIVIPRGETAIHDTQEGLEIGIAMLGFVKEIKANELQVGDLLVGFTSNGLHSNGFTKVRELFGEEPRPEFIFPTKIYFKNVWSLLDKINIHGMMHITGGAFTKLKDILPPDADINIGSNYNLRPHRIFYEIYGHGITDEEMYQTFNCGIGFILGMSKYDAIQYLPMLHSLDAEIIGEVVPGAGVIKIQSKFSGREICY